MEDDLYGSLAETTNTGEDANLYEGLFAGPSAAGNHETYLQHKVNELEETLRGRSTEVQLLKAKLRDHERKLDEVTEERDILLRNISCLYNTAKEEMARKQAEINSLRAEVAQATQRHHHHHQQQGGPQLALQPTSGAEPRQPARQALLGGAGGKRSRDGSVDAEGPQQAAGRQGSAADSWAGAKRPRSEGGGAAPCSGPANGEPGFDGAVVNGSCHTAGAAPPPRTGPHADAAVGPSGAAAWRTGGASGSGARARSVSSGGSLDDSRFHGQHHGSDRNRSSSHPAGSGSGNSEPRRGCLPPAPGHLERWQERESLGDKQPGYSRSSERPAGDDGRGGQDRDRLGRGRVGGGRMEDRRDGRSGWEGDRDRRY